MPILNMLAREDSSSNSIRPAALCFSMLFVFAVSCTALWSVSDRIDFHADEAIYLASVPVNLKNDSGIVFHAWYALIGGDHPTPLSARHANAILAALAITCLTATFIHWFPHRFVWIAIGMPCLLLISYQGLFVMLRVRPELSWLAVATLATYALSRIHKEWSISHAILAIVALTLLPMNHRLAWLACAAVGGYLFLFGWKPFGVRFTIAALTAMPMGILLQLGLRTWWLDSSWSNAFQAFAASTPAPPRLMPHAFLHNVFWVGAYAFDDKAAYANLWMKCLPNLGKFINHHGMAIWLWGLGCLLPLAGRSWEQRYLFSIPNLVLLAMYIAGYYNPTYFAMFTTLVVLSWVYVSMQAEQPRWLRVFALLGISLSLADGVSFIATRLINHGRASMFTLEPELRQMVGKIPPTASIAVPERFQSIAADHPGRRYVLFKDDVPEDIDYIVLDDYDFAMYRHFIERFDEKKKLLEQFMAEYESLEQRTVPVYWKDRLWPELVNGQMQTVQGSWFFRHSSQYHIDVLHKKTPH